MEANISTCLTYCKSRLFQESPSAMVRTQQNSKRLTGGHATCSKWANSFPVKAKTSSSRPKPHHKHQRVREQRCRFPVSLSMWCSLKPVRSFCYMCLNGGALHLCDHCPQAVCHQCLPPLPDVDVSNLDFLCLACHEQTFKRSHLPYYVSTRLDVTYLTHFHSLQDTMSGRFRSHWKNWNLLS